MAGADEGSRIRDVVRGSKIRLDILRKLDRQLGSYKPELNQGTIEIQNCSEQFQCHGRVLPRSAKGVEDCTYVRRLGRNRSPTAGSERRSNLQEANRRWVRSYLPLFKRTSNKEDLFEWFDTVDRFFEETQPLENTKCELASYVLEDEAEQWWQQLQHRRRLDGESEIKLWPWMKFLLSNDFWPAACSIKGSPEVENSSKVVNYGHNIPDEEESKAGCEYDAEAHNNNDEIAMEKTDKVTPTKCSTNYLSNIHLEKSVYMGSTELYNSVSDYSIRLTHGAEGCVKQVEEEKNIGAEVKLTNSATRKAVYNDEADSELGSTGVPAIKIVLPSATIDAKQKVKSVEARIECNDSFDVHKTKVVVSERLDSAIEVKQRKGVAVVKHLKADRFMPTTCSTKFLNQLNIHGTNDGRLSKILIENFDPGGKWQCRLSVDDGQGQVLHHATPSSRDSNVYIKKEKQSRVLQAISRVIEGCDFEVCHQNFSSTEKWCMVSINNSTGAVKEGKCEENDQLVRLKRFFTCDEKSFGNETMFVCSIMFLGGFIALKFLSIQEHFVWRSATCLCSWPGSIHDNIVSRYELKSQKPTGLLQFLFIDSAHLTLSKSVKMESIKSAFEFFGLPNSCGAIGATHTVMPLRETSVNCDDQDPTSYMFLCGNVDNEFRFLENINGWLRWMTITKPLSPRPLRFSSSDGSMIYASDLESRQYGDILTGYTYVVTPHLCRGYYLLFVSLDHTLKMRKHVLAKAIFETRSILRDVVTSFMFSSLGVQIIVYAYATSKLVLNRSSDEKHEEKDDWNSGKRIKIKVGKRGVDFKIQLIVGKNVVELFLKNMNNDVFLSLAARVSGIKGFENLMFQSWQQYAIAASSKASRDWRVGEMMLYTFDPGGCWSINKFNIQLFPFYLGTEIPKELVCAHKDIDLDLTRGRVIQGVGWNDVDNYDTTKAKQSIVTISSYLSISCTNGKSRGSLTLFHKVVNGLDPPMDIDGACESSMWNPTSSLVDELFG